MNQNIKCLTPQEEKKFLEVLRNRKDAERAYMLYYLMLVTGLRLSEALSLNVKDAGKVRTEVNVKRWTGKGARPKRIKIVYFPKTLQEHLKSYLKYKEKRKEPLFPESPLFISRNGYRISPRQVERDLKKWLKIAGIERDLSPSSLRHTTATRLLRKTRNYKLVQRYLGHSSPVTTLKFYVDVFPEDLEEAAEALTER